MDEKQVINAIRKAFNASPARDRGFFDDASFVDVDGKEVVLKADMFVAGTDMPPGMNLRQAARKSVISCLSDLASKGAEAKYFMISIGLPRRLNNERSVISIIDGLKQASKEYRVRLVGGDVNEGRELVIDCLMLGVVQKSAERRGAKVGDVVVSTDPFGYTGLGLKSLIHHLTLPNHIRKECLRRVYEPNPRFDVASRLVSSGYVNASMDSSDGLAATLYEISEQSGVSIEVDSIPTDEVLKNVFADSEEMKKILHDAVFYGGEEFSTIITFPGTALEKVEQLAHERGGRLYKIGRVVKGEGVFETTDGGKSFRRLRKIGWVHLKQK
jgi:thiamine-monophosphate kinase